MRHTVELNQLQADSLQNLAQQLYLAQERMNVFVAAVLAGVDVQDGQDVKLDGRILSYEVSTVELVE